ncbi:hypothetical protein COE15_19210, partial [Bacillus cereus]|uniref:hypothetical protein n=1 Tax=Bacillus sp. AFS023182 TaxID=2033492 RepID=UPI000BFB0E8B
SFEAAPFFIYKIYASEQNFLEIKELKWVSIHGYNKNEPLQENIFYFLSQIANLWFLYSESD